MRVAKGNVADWTTTGFPYRKLACTVRSRKPTGDAAITTWSEVSAGAKQDAHEQFPIWYVSRGGTFFRPEARL